MFDYSIVQICQILIALFLSIVMIQSGLDKAIDWKGNQSFLVEHFDGRMEVVDWDKIRSDIVEYEPHLKVVNK